MILYAIVAGDQVGVHGVDISLEKAALARGIEYHRLVNEDITLDDLRTMEFEPNSLLYRISLSAKAGAMEAMLASVHGDMLTTMYYPQTIAYPRKVNYELNQQFANGMRIIPTSVVDETWVNMSNAELNERVGNLGGFPIILKALGMSHGRGVQKVDTIDDLRTELSSVSYDKYNVILRKYLAEYRHYRLIVIEGRVAAAIEYHKPDNDFRTNAVAEPVVTSIDHSTLDESIVNLALEGVSLRSSILGGVDILVDQETGEPLLAEVNVPCYFPRAEEPTGIDIAGQIIEAMQRKQKEQQGE
ncbi:MAG: alpha-L-glutamate ligase, RimK family [Candidatus Saccharibacteria bacterium]|nr:alpha-L-glutamate ligase, RimK family [Candidatus Saccharibacteria bacterium]